MSDELKDLITKLLHTDPAQRLGTTTDADEIVEHPFFEDIDWDALMSRSMDSPFTPDMEYVRGIKADSIVYTDEKAAKMRGPSTNEKDAEEESDEDDGKLIAIAEDERNDQISKK